MEVSWVVTEYVEGSRGNSKGLAECAPAVGRKKEDMFRCLLVLTRVDVGSVGCSGSLVGIALCWRSALECSVEK